jgi:AraC family transcriptional regulator, arabinose operon regulatory protein
MSSNRVQYLGASHLDPDPAWEMKSHRHPLFHELIVVFRGKIHVRIADRDVMGSGGDVLYYPKGVWHAERSDAKDPVETYYLAWKGPTGEWDYVTHDADGRIHLLIQWLYQERISSFGAAAALNASCLKTVLAELSRLTAQKGQSNLVREIRTYIQDHLGDPLTLNHLAEKGGMSKFHFIRRYRELSGRTPMEDLRIIRVEAARNLVMTTDLPLKAIATRVGLCNEYYLCRLAAKYLKTTLGSFRKLPYRT